LKFAKGTSVCGDESQPLNRKFNGHCSAFWNTISFKTCFAGTDYVAHFGVPEDGGVEIGPILDMYT
jgi:hypothetical protein